MYFPIPELKYKQIGQYKVRDYLHVATWAYHLLLTEFLNFNVLLALFWRTFASWVPISIYKLKGRFHTTYLIARFY